MIENVVNMGYGAYVVVVSGEAGALIERVFGELIRAGFCFTFVA